MLLYVHVPFCAAKCRYCAFHSYTPTEGDTELYLRALVNEIRMVAEHCDDRDISSVYFGGGTPSLLTTEDIALIIRTLRKHFSFRKNVEFSFEVNPDSIGDKDSLRALLAMGVNRLSMGAQSFDDDMLETLGRPHNAKDAREAYRLAREAGFGNISVDLIWGLPGQRLPHWLKELKKVVRLNPTHLSCFGLPLEEGTPMEEDACMGKLTFAEEQEQAKMFIYGAEFLESEGYIQYEISNFARMGYMCRHNIGYWEGKDFLGFGPAAVSTVRGVRRRNQVNLGEYVQSVRSGEILRGGSRLDRTAMLKELLMLRLRTSKGLPLKSYRLLTGRKFIEDFAPFITMLRRHELIRLSGGTMRLTKAGMLVSNTILENFFDKLDKLQEAQAKASQAD